ncbi:hypothetical protein ACR777_21155 [Sphingobacterium spiritivorum]|uniref:hypothetical protein n=1 Tax=Sphingobacterium spiritivorum TaxID=258 RepID=UPI003DA50863
MLNFIKYFALLLTLSLATKCFAQNHGINTKNTGNSLTANGSFAGIYKTVAANTALSITDYYTAYNGSSAGIITLPAAISGTGNFKGRIYYIKNTSNSALTVAASGAELIEGAPDISSVIVPPGYYVKLISKGTTTGSTWAFLMLVNGKTDDIIQVSGNPYAVPQGGPATEGFSVNSSSYTVVNNSSSTFTLPVAKPIFLSFALGIDDFTTNSLNNHPYIRCELFIDGVATGLFQIIKEHAVGFQLQFNISGVRNLPAGTHTIDARIIRWYNDGFTGNQNFRTLSVVFSAVYLN